MTLRNLAIYSVVLVAISVALTRYYWPSIQKQTEVQEKEVVKTRIVTQIREVVRPDGTTDRTTVITDNSEEVRRRIEKHIERVTSKWLVGVSAVTSYDKMEPEYGLQLSRRVAGPFLVGVSGSKERAGLLISMEF